MTSGAKAQPQIGTLMAWLKPRPFKAEFKLTHYPKSSARLKCGCLVFRRLLDVVDHQPLYRGFRGCQPQPELLQSIFQRWGVRAALMRIGIVVAAAEWHGKVEPAIEVGMVHHAPVHVGSEHFRQFRHGEALKVADVAD